MVFKNLCVFVHWTIIASALVGLSGFGQKHSKENYTTPCTCTMHIVRQAFTTQHYNGYAILHNHHTLSQPGMINDQVLRGSWREITVHDIFREGMKIMYK